MAKTFIIQHTETGDFDYSEYTDPDAAWDAEKSADWVQTSLEEGIKTLEECRKEFISSLRTYSEQEVAQAHKEGYKWPEALGLLNTKARFTEFSSTIQVCDIADRVDLLLDMEQRDEAETEDILELLYLLELMDGIKMTGGDYEWRGDTYPTILIGHSYFKDYAMSLAEDSGMLENMGMWPLTCIDWDQAAFELGTDYSRVDFRGVTFLFR